MDKKQFIHDLQTQEFYDAYNNFIFADDSKVFNKLYSKFFFLGLTHKIPGEVVELGVFKGSGMAAWLKTGRAMQSTRKVIVLKQLMLKLWIVCSKIVILIRAVMRQL